MITLFLCRRDCNLTCVRVIFDFDVGLSLIHLYCGVCAITTVLYLAYLHSASILTFLILYTFIMHCMNQLLQWLNHYSFLSPYITMG